MEFHKIWLKLLVFFVFTQGVLSLPTDLTMRFQEKGKDVVDAVNFLIKDSGIFPEDYRFLLRLAYIETLYGTLPHTFPSFYYGGIWQVNQTIFAATKDVTNYPSLSQYHAQIQSSFGIDWMSSLTSWSRCQYPLYSGLALRLYFTAVVSNSTPIPDTISLQASHWQTHFNSTGNITHFIQEIKALETEFEEALCDGAKIKFATILDGSGSVGASDFRRGTSFAINLISMFNLNNTKISFITYSDSSNVIVPLQNNLTMSQISTIISSTPYPARGTNTHLGINSGITQLNVTDDDRQRGIPSLMLVLTDGLSNNRPATIESANRAVAEGIKTFSIGIGTGIDATELLAIAGNESSRVLSLTSFDALVELPYHLSSEMCAIPQETGLCITIEDTLKFDESRYYLFEVTQESLSIDLGGQTGGIVSVYSYNSFPNPALNAGELTNGWNYIRYQSSQPHNNITILVRGTRQASSSTYTLRAYNGMMEDC